jgi:Ca-activated chloride channel family protein
MTESALEFALPWALLALLLPLLARQLLPRASERTSAALRIPFLAALRSLPDAGAGGVRRKGLRLGLAVLVYASLVLAAAQPEWIGPAQPVPTRGRDLMLALDLSGSMANPDFEVRGQPVDRFTVVRAVARRFALDRKGDRVGLILFGTRAFLQAPVTPDRETVAALLDESEVGLAGEETAIGDAIGLAVKHLRDRPADERVLVLLSDGASNAGVLDPRKAAELAAQAGIRIYTIGIGTDTQLVQTLFGAQRVRVGSDLDDATLEAIADATGGTYFRAEDTESLVRVYREIDALEPTEGDPAQLRPRKALFAWPLGAALALAGLGAVAQMAADARTWSRT